MAQYTVGDYIRENRKKAGISQEELAYGVCEASTLSRIESGSQMPSRRTYEALMQKLGKDVSLFSFFSSRKEMEIYQLEMFIGEKLANRNLEGLRELYEKLNALADKNNPLERQYVMYVDALIQNLEGEGAVAILPQLIEAVHQTRPDFDLENPEQAGLLTFHEINLLNNIAIAYWKGGKKESGMGLMLYLKEYMEKNLIDEKEKGGHYPMVLANLAKWLLEEEKVQEALEICEDGIEACLHYGKLLLFPVLLLYKAGALERLGESEKAIDAYRQVYYMSKAMKNDNRAKEVKGFMLEQYKILLE